MTSTLRLAAVLFLVAASAACGGGSNNDAGPGEPDGGGPNGPDGGPDICSPDADRDGDGILSGIEGCEDVPPRDTDGDGTPDWQDEDSDNDGIDDGLEDRNGDGVIGECTTACSDSMPCGEGFTCSTPMGAGGAGWCVAFSCLDGETDPLNPDTDADGQEDDLEPTRICNPREETSTDGLKPFRTVDSAAAIDGAEPNWKIAVEVEGVIDGPIDWTGAEPLNSAYWFDYSDPVVELAGWLISRPATPDDGSAVGAAQDTVERLRLIPGVTTLGVRASGIRTTSLDGYDTVINTTLVAQTSAATDVTVFRQRVMEAVANVAPGTLVFQPVGWSGPPTTQLIVTMQTVFRTDTSQIVFMGTVSALDDYDDRTRTTGFLADDHANGTGLTLSGNDTTPECEQFLEGPAPKADIIWVLDHSGSMDDNRQNISNNSTTFFNYALAAGLNFRMGVLDMNPGYGGKFASRDNTTSTGDRWVLSSDLATFQANVIDPDGPDPTTQEEKGPTTAMLAVQRHLPRDNGDAAKIREEAKLVVIMVSDEHPEEIEDAGIIPEGTQFATAQDISDIYTELKPQIDLLEENQSLVHAIAIPENDPPCDTGEIGYGYREMTIWFGGVFADICQTDLGASLQAIIDDVLGQTSDIVLEWVPISITISVMRDGELIPRSRETGWDYNAASNAIIFFGYPPNPEDPAEIIISYQRWSEQIPIE